MYFYIKLEFIIYKRLINLLRKNLVNGDILSLYSYGLDGSEDGEFIHINIRIIIIVLKVLQLNKNISIN